MRAATGTVFLSSKDWASSHLATPAYERRVGLGRWSSDWSHINPAVSSSSSCLFYGGPTSGLDGVRFYIVTS